MSQEILKNDSISPERFALLNESTRIFSLLKQDLKKSQLRMLKCFLITVMFFDGRLLANFLA